MADSIQNFMIITGADQETAGRVMASAQGDMDAAVELYYESVDEEADGDEPEDAEAAKPGLPKSDLVSAILHNARKDPGPSQPNPWAGPGRAVSSDPSRESPPAGSAPEASSSFADRRNAKRVRIIFWADGFTVEDLNEAEAEAAAAAAPAHAPRKTGVQTLSDQNRAGGAGDRRMRMPELRKYEENRQLMEDLEKGLPPNEFREVDLSSGTPVRPSPLLVLCALDPLRAPLTTLAPCPPCVQMPRPVDIMLGDLRPAKYPVPGQGQLPVQSHVATAELTPFAGAGRSMREPPAEGAETPAAVPPTNSHELLSVDAAEPQTTLHVRLHDGKRTVIQANHSHTVRQLEGHVAALTPAVAFELRAGFPPKSLAPHMDKTLKAAGLLSESILQAAV